MSLIDSTILAITNKLSEQFDVEGLEISKQGRDILLEHPECSLRIKVANGKRVHILDEQDHILCRKDIAADRDCKPEAIAHEVFKQFIEIVEERQKKLLNKCICEFSIGVLEDDRFEVMSMVARHDMGVIRLYDKQKNTTISLKLDGDSVVVEASETCTFSAADPDTDSKIRKFLEE